MVHYFLEGGNFMWPILISLLFGIGFAIERFYSLMMSAVDSQTFFDEITSAIDENGATDAVQLCKETEGPVSAIFHAGLSKMHRGLDDVEKAIQNAGSIEMAFLEKNMIWLNAVITIAPMIGFTGTVVGMISAFDAIKAANDISPAVVAGGISVALLTTAFGLVVALILQLLQNTVMYIIDNQVVTLQKSTSLVINSITDHFNKK